MKIFVAFALIVAVASAGVIKPISNEEAQIQAIIDAIQSPSTDPATAILLQQQLFQLLGVAPPSPVIVDIADPVAVVDEAISPVEVVEEAVVAPIVVVDEAAPAPVAPVIDPSPASSPLVQVILNINAPAGAVEVSPAGDYEVPYIRPPIAVVDPIVPEPIVLPPTPIFPVQPEPPTPIFPVVVEPVLVNPTPIFPVPEPVIVPPTPIFPVEVEPVLIGDLRPVNPAITLPEILN
ncbi:proline-rich extensin-like protein EPR1 [Hyposmocoma kahamanoa]|uniref:proline-rich extensin-like protein EPR1 n=1 Tax=Hyposmocoma kahamanoa TaxID=1477025 RepID=UPI000E6D8BBC|nr:proline-rich extensin-like protein EPR1 [Hyposmocoma kahamanoa]